MPSIIKKKVSPKPTKSVVQTKPKATGPAPASNLKPKPKTLKPAPKASQSPKPAEAPKLSISPIAVKKVDPLKAPAPIAIMVSSKQAQVIALLSNPQGVKLPELMQATGWQAHSVRGFLSGTIKKKLNLNLISQKHDGAQIYRIASGD